GEASPLACGYRYIKAVAAGDTARGVDEHSRQPVVFRRRKAHAQGARFMQAATPRDAVLAADVKAHGALRAVGRENRRSSARLGPHPTPGSGRAGRIKSQGHLAADLGRIEPLPPDGE